LAAVERVLAAGKEALGLADEFSRFTVVAVPPSKVLTSLHDGLIQGWPFRVVVQQAAEGARAVALGFSMELAEQRTCPPVQHKRFGRREPWASIGPAHPREPGHDQIRNRRRRRYLAVGDQPRKRDPGIVADKCERPPFALAMATRAVGRKELITRLLLNDRSPITWLTAP